MLVFNGKSGSIVIVNYLVPVAAVLLFDNVAVRVGVSNLRGSIIFKTN